MNTEKIMEFFHEQTNSLEKIISEIDKQITSSDESNFFTENVNFFTKAFLISLCSYLEIILKDIANEHLITIQKRIESANIPHNLVIYSLNPKKGDNSNLKYSNYKLTIKDIPLDDEISGNPYKIEKFFEKIGVNLSEIEGFKDNKIIVDSIVRQRNKIIHHNDSAINLSLQDIKSYCSVLKVYVESIAISVKKLHEFKSE